MSVRKRTWTTPGGETREVWIVDYRDQDRRRHIETFTQKKAADARHAEVKVDVKAGTHVPISTSITVEKAAEIWIGAVELGRDGRSPAEPSTLRQYRGLLVLPQLRHTKLANLTTPQVAQFRDHLLKTMSRPLAKKVLGSLKSIVGEAQSRGLVKMNAAAPVKISTGGRHEVALEIPTIGEIDLIVSKLNELATQADARRARAWRRFRALIVAAIETGMRASELRGLPWDAVDLKVGTITVRQRADEKGRPGPPKSKAGRRTIYISHALVDLLRLWKIESARPWSLPQVWVGQTTRQTYSIGAGNRCYWLRAWFWSTRMTKAERSMTAKAGLCVGLNTISIRCGITARHGSLPMAQM